MATKLFSRTVTQEVRIVGTRVSAATNELIVWIDTPWEKLSEELKTEILTEGYRQAATRTRLKEGHTLDIKQRVK